MNISFKIPIETCSNGNRKKVEIIKQIRSKIQWFGFSNFLNPWVQGNPYGYYLGGVITRINPYYGFIQGFNPLSF